MGMKTPVVAEIAYKTWCINEFGLDAMFLFEGEEKALLIDTGSGCCDLKELVQSLTNKPIIVALTHGHVDHAGGIKQFDEIYLHEDDFEIAKAVSLKDRQEYANLLMTMFDGVFDPVTCIDFKKDPKLIGIKEGYSFDLGNRIIQVYETPGHTEGGLSYLDTKERILLSGDACNPNILLLDTKEKNSISNVLKSAEKCKALDFDRHYNGHVGYAGYITFLPLPECLIQDTIDLCHDILSGKVKGEPTYNPFGGNCLIAKNHTMQIQYKEKNIK